ncbi:MAG: protein-glutamate O-methyltransferase [Deltaproteobacteria bacterium]|nr:protein-glutamate O-methyltransferase [Deltaproteobacteria bacterium]
MEALSTPVSLKRLSEDEFKKLSSLVNGELGIKMPPAKRTLLESRLQKRLRALGLASYAEYCDLLFNRGGMKTELVHMLDLVTTNKTDFFREAHHFEYLVSTAVPALLGGRSQRVSLWSAGCSSGEEPYTLAMVLSEYARLNQGAGFDFTIAATDISTRVLEAACRGVYNEERVAPVPMELRRRYFLKSKDASRSLVRVTPELRSKIAFSRVNLMDEEYAIDAPVDIIFCRNVIIYFDKPTQERLFSRFCEYMSPGGFLFIGHSETLSGFDLPLKKVGASVYMRQ